MEILEILKKSKEDIYPEDLDFFETELATGEYSQAYIALCQEQIGQMRKWLDGEDDNTALHEEETPNVNSQNALVRDVCAIAPESSKRGFVDMSLEDVIFSDIKSLRESDNYKNKFKKYVQDNKDIDDAFIDTHYSFFMQWELGVIVSVKQLGEEFLEKYFGALDKEKISRYQCFSESFFMKHYSQLDVATVLTKGKNPWRKKENRSKQLDVFLRLKGVKL